MSNGTDPIFKARSWWWLIVIIGAAGAFIAAARSMPGKIEKARQEREGMHRSLDRHDERITTLEKTTDKFDTKLDRNFEMMGDLKADIARIAGAND